MTQSLCFCYLKIMVAVAVRSLSSLALPDACPRCFWLQEKLEGKPPFQFGMPGIFWEIDGHAKGLVRSALDSGRDLPTWYPEFGNVVAYLPEEELDWRRFGHRDEETGILVRGVPDEVLQLADGSYHIVDYKTARITDRQDELFPLYEAQLNAYGFIAERLEYAPVSGLSLLYLEPRAGTDAGGDELMLPFRAVRKDVALRPELIRTLLGRAERILSLSAAPAGREGCEDCRQLEKLLGLADRVPF